MYEGVNPHIAEHIRSIPPETTLRITGLSDQEPEGLVSATVRLSDGFEEGSELDYYHAVVTAAIGLPEDLDALECPAGTWAVFENTGPFPQALQRMWGDVAAQWIPSNPYEYRPGPEILSTRPSQDDTAQSHSQSWIPVARTAR